MTSQNEYSAKPLPEYSWSILAILNKPMNSREICEMVQRSRRNVHYCMGRRVKRGCVGKKLDTKDMRQIQYFRI